MTTKKPQQSRFLTLPAELRNTIYEHALCGKGHILVRQGRSDHQHRPKSLLHTCQQIRAEASPIYYTQNIFRHYVPDRESALPPIRPWLFFWPAIIGKQACALLTHFEIGLAYDGEQEAAFVRDLPDEMAVRVREVDEAAWWHVQYFCCCGIRAGAMRFVVCYEDVNGEGYRKVARWRDAAELVLQEVRDDLWMRAVACYGEGEVQ
ncbi:hypothetical protein LTR86_003728 [Recurvomyces mirabilis]|nr:hypothetical protein LTR86_003728 [Recurvomyces mirabilis]